jgi:ABC-type dipeptide/oligopeptide/nickel transport system permease subunit
MSWSDSSEDREESLRRLREGLRQKSYDLSRSWKIFSRSFLAVLGLFLVIVVSTISIFADDIAVEHPYRNLQDTEDLWWIDYEPSRKAPFSEECDWHEQKIDLFDMRRGENNRTRAWSDEIWSEERQKIIRKPLQVIEILNIEDTNGYPLNGTWVTIDPSNDTWLIVSNDVLEDTSFTGSLWVTYEFNNEEMHHSWLPDGYDVCILGTNHEGQDLFSKVLYGSRISLKIGFTVALFTVALGTIVGCISGYFGGRVDEVIMRICDVFFAIPGLILAMAFVAALESTVRLSTSMSAAVMAPLILLAIFARSVVSEKVSPMEREPEEADYDLMMIGIPTALVVAIVLYDDIIPLEGNLVPLLTTAIISSFLVLALLGRYAFNIPFRGNRYAPLLVSASALLLAISLFHDYWDQGGRPSRIFLIVVFIFLILALTIMEKNISRRVPLSTFVPEGDNKIHEKMVSAASSSLKSMYTNPYRFLTLRTLLVSVSAALLFTASGSSDSEFIIIKDFDRLWKIQVALIFTGWPGYARLIRGQVLYVKEMSFVEAAKSVGAPDSRIMFRHILPNAWAPLLVAFTLDIGGTILSASGLSFIGLGAEPGTAEWGILVDDGRRWFPDDWWMITFPGIAIAITTLGFNLLGDGLRDVVDPKNRR